MWTTESAAGLRAPGKRRVVMVLESVFPSPRAGGAEGQVLTLARHLRAQEIDVVVVVPLLPRGSQSLQDRVEGFEVIRIPYPRIRRLGGAVLGARLAWLLWTRRRGYAAIHAHIANTMAAVCCLAGRAAGRPVVVKPTGALELKRGILDARQQRLSTWALRWSLRRATAYQAISSRIASQLAVCGFREDKVHVVPNGIDLEHYRPGENRSDLRCELGIASHRVGLFVGRLTEDKGLSILLQAWANVFSRDQEVALLLVGAGSLETELRRSCRNLGIAHQVKFLGSQSDVRPFLAAADFAVLSSEFEGLSNALLEYMAAGLPVIGSRVSGTEDLVREGENGWLFESGAVGELEDCLDEAAQLSQDALRAMGQRGRIRVGAVAAVSTVTRSLADLYAIPLNAPPLASP